MAGTVREIDISCRTQENGLVLRIFGSEHLLSFLELHYMAEKIHTVLQTYLAQPGLSEGIDAVMREHGLTYLQAIHETNKGLNEMNANADFSKSRERPKTLVEAPKHSLNKEVPMKGSYTLLNTYQLCPKQAFHKYVAKDIPFRETAPQKWGNEVHNGMDKRLSSGVPLTGELAKYEMFAQPLDRFQPKTEVRLGMRANGTPCGFYDADCYFCCKVDVLIIQNETALIFDWKTGKTYEDPTELRMQALLVHVHNPSIRRITGRYVWLANNQLGQEHDLSDVELTDAELDSRMEHFGNALRMNYFPEREGPLCQKHCDVHTCRFNGQKA